MDALRAASTYIPARRWTSLSCRSISPALPRSRRDHSSPRSSTCSRHDAPQDAVVRVVRTRDRSSSRWRCRCLQAPSPCCSPTAISALLLPPDGGGDPPLFQHLSWFFGHRGLHPLLRLRHGEPDRGRRFSRKPVLRLSRHGLRWWRRRHRLRLGGAQCMTVGMSASVRPTFIAATMVSRAMTGGRSSPGSPRCGAARSSSRRPCVGGRVHLPVPSAGHWASSSPMPAWAPPQDTYYVVAHFHRVLFARRRVRHLRRLVLLVPEDDRLCTASRCKLHWLTSSASTVLPGTSSASPGCRAVSPTTRCVRRLELRFSIGSHFRVRRLVFFLRRGAGLHPQAARGRQSVGCRRDDAGMDPAVAAAVPSV